MNARVLVIEDDAASRNELVSMLAARNCQADAAGDGFTALRLAQDNHYDLVLVDYHLPEMDGYAFARLMRTLALRTGTRFRMAAIADGRDSLAARRSGDAIFDQVLFKPVDPNALYDCVAAMTAAAPASFEPDGEMAAFFEEPAVNREHAASHALWRVRGLSGLPNAAMLPKPPAADFQKLSYCFTPGSPETADCVVLLGEAGLAGLATLRETSSRYLLPVFGLTGAVQAACDHLFNPADAESWTEVARIIKNVQLRTVLLKNEVRMSGDAALRILAYLFVSERAVCLHRDEFGATTVSRTAGFNPDCIIMSLKSLAARGLITSRSSAASLSGGTDLEVLPNERGLACILDGRMTASRSYAG